MLLAQNSMTLNIAKNYVSEFGENSNMVTFSPLFKLESNTIYKKSQPEIIKAKPNFSKTSNIAYGFILFLGNNNSVFNRQVTVLVENYDGTTPILHIDRNGNLDFTDDREPIYFKNEFLLKLSNSELKGSNYVYNVSKSKIKKENELTISNRYSAKFPKSTIVSPKFWLVLERLSMRVSKGEINGKPISILIRDGDVNGIYTFDPNNNGDRIVLLDTSIDETQSLLFYLRNAEPIDHNAVFVLYGKKYFIQQLTKNGDQLTLSETEKNTKVLFNEGKDVSNFSIELLSGETKTLAKLIKDKTLLIDVGGTWCGGCITQEPTIKKMYNEKLVDVIGLFAHDTKTRVDNYVKKHNIEWPVALMSKEFLEKFKTYSYPTFIVISKDRKVEIIERNAEKLYNYLTK